MPEGSTHAPGRLRIGTCSWKYPSWAGILYSAGKDINYLAEYSEHYDTVEIDQWFWSLFDRGQVVLPDSRTVDEYAHSVPASFRFTVKAPNAITLTHPYKRYTKGALIPNPHFLSKDLLEQFLACLAPISERIGLIMFQFEYLNKQKISGMREFVERLDAFFAVAPDGFSYAIEPRNPQIFGAPYFDLLTGRSLSHVFLQGYFMPDIRQIYRTYGKRITGKAVLRLHGYERDAIEQKTGKVYDRIVEPKDDELPGIIAMVQDLRERGVEVYLNVNNHYEGSSPLTIRKIRKLIADLSD